MVISTHIIARSRSPTTAGFLVSGTETHSACSMGAGSFRPATHQLALQACGAFFLAGVIYWWSMIVFSVSKEGISWRLERNHRLVCYFQTQNEAEEAANRFVANLVRRGEEARVDSGGKRTRRFTSASEPT